MREITTKLYKFDELDERAKDRARDWYKQSPLDQETAWEQTLDDAKEIGLDIFSLEDHKMCEGKFISSAEETAHKIENEHGEACETHKTASAYLQERDKVINDTERDENGDIANEYELDEKLDELDKDFLHSLLEDYRIMLNKEIEYRYSDESVDESIRANEYEFTEEGKRS